MANITTALLDFLMGLLKSPEAGAAFAADPDAALQNAGLQGICAADVDAVLPVALDFSPVGNREYDTGGNDSSAGGGGGGWLGGAGGGGGGGGGWGGGGHNGDGDHGGDHHGGGKRDWDDDHGDYAAAKAKLVSVVNNYSYVDDRDVINDQSVNQINTILAGIWFGVAYLKTRDLWFVWGMHLMWNWMQGAFFGIEVSGMTNLVTTPLLREIDSGPAWLTGDSYGVEGGIVTTIAIVVSTVVIYFLPGLKASHEMLEWTGGPGQSRER